MEKEDRSAASIKHRVTAEPAHGIVKASKSISSATKTTLTALRPAAWSFSRRAVGRLIVDAG